MKTENPKLFDVRLKRQNLQKGLLKADDFDKHLKSLPDESENGEYNDLETILEDQPLNLPSLSPIDTMNWEEEEEAAEEESL